MFPHHDSRRPLQRLPIFDRKFSKKAKKDSSENIKRLNSNQLEKTINKVEDSNSEEEKTRN
jgi:hypothetical protein